MAHALRREPGGHPGGRGVMFQVGEPLVLVDEKLPVAEVATGNQQVAERLRTRVIDAQGTIAVRLVGRQLESTTPARQPPQCLPLTESLLSGRHVQVPPRSHRWNRDEAGRVGCGTQRIDVATSAGA